MSVIINDEAPGVTLNSGGQVTITAIGGVSGVDGIYVTSGSGTVDNAGIIVAGNYGVDLLGGGTVTNTAGGRIVSGISAVNVEGGSGTVYNAGIMAGTYYGVYLTGGGTVTNTAGAIIEGTQESGVSINFKSGTVDNAGTIIGGENGEAVDLGIFGKSRLVIHPGAVFVGRVSAFGGGNVLELASGSSTGTISGIDGLTPQSGVSQYYGFSTITVDAGADWTLMGNNTAADGVTLSAGSSLTNDGTLTGEIIGSGAVSVTNTSLGLISASGDGIYVNGGSGTVYNAGSIVGGGSYGVELFAGGVVTNTAGGFISGSVAGVYVNGGPGIVYNAGSVAGDFGVVVYGAAAVTNTAGGVVSGSAVGIDVNFGSGAVYNVGSIVGGGTGVYLHDGGIVTNASGGYIYGSFADTFADDGSGSICNAGSLAGSGIGVLLFDGGAVTNAAGGVISVGGNGIYFYGGSGAIYNAGSVAASNGVKLNDGGAVTNAAGGVIFGSNDGIYVKGGTGSIYNAGSIVSMYEYGVALNAGGAVTNAVGGVIAGGRDGGIYITGGSGTVYNAGTISGGGGAAVVFDNSGNNLLVIDPGAVFFGGVEGNGNVLELASGSSAGTISGIGTSFTGFNSIGIDTGASWTLTGSNTLSANSTLTNTGTLALADTTLNDSGTVVNDGVITIDPSTVTLDDLIGTGSTTIESGSTLLVTGTVSAGETIAFGAGGGVFSIGDAQDMSGTISGLGAGDTIDLMNLGYVDGATATLNGDTLIVMDGATTETLSLAGAVTSNFLLEASGTDIDTLCYLRGTKILTPAGRVNVERLQIGDLVVTRFGGIQPIKWIGRQSHAAVNLKHDLDKHPVRIRAGALGANQPSWDLFVSPGHSMLVDGQLLLARLLVNGVTIMQDKCPQKIHYYQIELEAHDCVIAEGTWSETYADCGEMRNQFDNADAFYALYPGYRPPEELSLCAPRPEKGARLEAALRPVAARAATGLQPGALRGWIDRVRAPWSVEGWAQDENHPEMPVLLEALLDGEVIGNVLACGYRDDLREAGMGSGRCAFTFSSPVNLPEHAAARLHFRRVSDGAPVPGSAQLLDAAQQHGRKLRLVG